MKSSKQKLNSSFNHDYDKYYGRSYLGNTNESFSLDHDNNYESNTNFSSNTNPSSGSNYNQNKLNTHSGLSSKNYGKGPLGYKRSDEKIKEDVCNTLYIHHEIDASEIEVSVLAGTLKLSGFIGSRKLKRLVENIVENLPGVEDVQNLLIISYKDNNPFLG